MLKMCSFLVILLSVSESYLYYRELDVLNTNKSIVLGVRIFGLQLWLCH